jgi:hypothetical protein
VKVFFDNCTSPVLAQTLNGFVNHRGHEAVHLRDRFAQDSADVEWITALGEEEETWVVITGDDRIRKNRAERAAYREAQIRGFVLAPAYHTTKHNVTASVLVRRWPDIEDMVGRFAPPFLVEMPINYSSKLRFLPL